jgi:hypothetical protein
LWEFGTRYKTGKIPKSYQTIIDITSSKYPTFVWPSIIQIERGGVRAYSRSDSLKPKNLQNQILKKVRGQLGEQHQNVLLG